MRYPKEVVAVRVGDCRIELVRVRRTFHRIPPGHVAPVVSGAQRCARPDQQPHGLQAARKGSQVQGLAAVMVQGAYGRPRAQQRRDGRRLAWLPSSTKCRIVQGLPAVAVAHGVHRRARPQQRCHLRSITAVCCEVQGGHAIAVDDGHVRARPQQRCHNLGRVLG